MRKEKLRAIEKQLGPAKRAVFFRFWNDPDDILRPLLPPYHERANSILTPAEMESLGPVERIRDHRQLDIVLQGALFGAFGLAPARPAIGGMVQMYKTESGPGNWALELFRLK